MIKVTLPARTTNSMGSVSSPVIDFESGDNWEVVEGSLVVLDEDEMAIAQFAPGHWAYAAIILVD